jgi:hypothetical protein
LDFSNAGATSDLLNTYSPVSMGGGTLQIIGNAANASTQNFTNGSGLTVNPGFNVITVGPNGGNMADPLPTLNLGSVYANGGFADDVCRAVRQYELFGRRYGH